MEELKFSPKDAKIVKDNPNATPYELLEKGISQKAYERLLDAKDAEAIEQTQTEKIQTDIVVDVQKIEKELKPKAKGEVNGIVTVIDTDKGKEIPLYAKDANFLVSTDTKRYRIKNG